MKRIRLFLVLAVLLWISNGAYAQNNAENPKYRIYSSFSYNHPFDNMDRYQYGFGVYSNLDIYLNKHIAFRLDIGWNDFSGPEKEYVDDNNVVHTDHPNMSVWEFTGGFRLMGGPLYLEGRGGYFTGVNSWGVVPAVGFQVWKLDIQVGYTYTFTNQKTWGVARIGYYF